MRPDVQLEVPGSRVLLHCCCAPCSGAVVECLVANGIRPTLFFSNANIVPREEYELRRSELCRYAAQYGLEVIDDEDDHAAWLAAVRGLEREPERGARCLQCFRYRLLRAARYAAAHGYDVLATTLASSRWKDLAQVDQAGREACETVSAEAVSVLALGGSGAGGPDGGEVLALGAGRRVVWWGQNWRKGGLQPRRSEIIREQGFYNQTWCGCEFSRHD